MARSKTVDKITPTAEVFIVTWYKSLVNMMSEQSWGYVGIISFILLLIGVSFYIFGNRLWIKKTGFIGAVVFLIVTVCSNIFASEQKAELAESGAGRPYGSHCDGADNQCQEYAERKRNRLVRAA